MNNKKLKPKSSDKFASFLGGKYDKPPPPMSVNDEMAPDNHDWVFTPVFSHLIQGTNEIDALKGT